MAKVTATVNGMALVLEGDKEILQLAVFGLNELRSVKTLIVESIED